MAMGRTSAGKRPRPSDRLDSCAAVWMVAGAWVLAVWLAIGAHLALHGHTKPCAAALAGALDILSPALLPPGSALGDRVTITRAVDLRHGPGVPFPSIDPARLLIGPAGGNRSCRETRR